MPETRKPFPEKLPFVKMTGTGNDFIFFDNRAGIFSGDESGFFRDICRRKLSVGADGVVLVERGRSAPVRMRYYNADGLEAAMCGNAGRCTARFAVDRGMVKRNEFTLEAADGLHEVSVLGDSVSIKMRPASGYQTDLGILREPEFEEGGFVDTGVPHYVIFVPDAERVSVRELAPYYRRHSAFSEGANVNFVQVLGPRRIRVRTFERGVEDETLSCGTGCAASALVASRLKGCVSPVAVETRGGELSVSFDREWRDMRPRRARGNRVRGRALFARKPGRTRPMKRIIIIDGYNLLFQIPELRRQIERDMEGARERLLDSLAVHAARHKAEYRVVFDGDSPNRTDTRRRQGLRVTFSTPPLKADPLIKKMLAEKKRNEDMIVVTSDLEICNYARLCGVKVEKSQKFAMDMTSEPGSELEKKFDHRLSQDEVDEWMNLFKVGRPGKPFPVRARGRTFSRPAAAERKAWETREESSSSWVFSRR